MGVKQDQRVIGEVTYRVTQLTALKSRALFARLIRFLGPALSTAISGGNVRNVLQSVDVASLVADVASRFTDDELEYFCSVLGECSEIVADNGNTQKINRGVLDVHFAGRLLDMFKWLAFALEVQFSDFLSVLKATPAVASAAPANPASQSPSLSTGTSGVS